MNEVSPLYWYAAVLQRIVDGDTMIVDVDLGMHIWQHGITLRVAGIDTPEPRGDTKEAGVKATVFAEDFFSTKHPVFKIHTMKEDSFGRWIAEIVFEDGDNYGDVMLKTGNAEPYKK